jgi:hypothetical protein
MLMPDFLATTFPRWSVLRAAIVTTLAVFTFEAKADTVDLMEFFGVNHSVDVAINKFQALVDHAGDVAIGVESKTNSDVKDRIDQINVIVDKTVTDLRALEKTAHGDINAVADKMIAAIDKSVDNISALEEKFFADLDNAVQNVYCKTITFATDVVKNSCGTVCKLVGGYQIEITAPVMYPGEHATLCIQDCRITQTFPMRTPFDETYKEVKSYMEGRLKGARNDTPVQSILATYGYLSSLAAMSECVLPSLKPFYDAEIIHYNGMLRGWETVNSAQE